MPLRRKSRMAHTKSILFRGALNGAVVLTVLGAAYAASSSEPGRLIIDDVSAVVKSDMSAHRIVAPEAAIRTTEPVYFADGTKAGSIRAVVTRNGEAHSIHVGPNTYSADQFRISDGRLIVTEQILAETGDLSDTEKAAL